MGWTARVDGPISRWATSRPAMNEETTSDGRDQHAHGTAAGSAGDRRGDQPGRAWPPCARATCGGPGRRGLGGRTTCRTDPWEARPAGPDRRAGPDHKTQPDRTADSRRAAYLDGKGKVRLIDRCAGDPAAASRTCRRSAGVIGQPAPFVAPHGTSIDVQAGTIPMSYSGLRTLPRTPSALVAHLGDLRFPHWAGWSCTRPLPKSQASPSTATPSMSPADRHSASMALPPAFGGGIDEIVINLRTHELAGQQLLTTPHAGSPSRVLSGTAILQASPVSGPGQVS